MCKSSFFAPPGRTWKIVMCLALAAVLQFDIPLNANHLVVLNPQVDIDANASAHEFCALMPTIVNVPGNAFNPNYPGADFGIYRRAEAVSSVDKSCLPQDDGGEFHDCEGECPCPTLSHPSEVLANGISRARITGNNSSSVGFDWVNIVNAKSNVIPSDCCLWGICEFFLPCPANCQMDCQVDGYAGSANNTLEVSFSLQVVAPSGSAVVSFNTSTWLTEIDNPEAGTDDDATPLPFTLEVNGQPVTPYSSVSMNVLDGELIDVYLNTDVSTFIGLPEDPNLSNPCLMYDRAEAALNGAMSFQISGAPIAVVPPPVESEPCGIGCTFPLFSLDIGSDMELSDPLPAGDEYFDPGDMYADFGWPTPPIGGEDGFLDDANIFAGFDRFPDAPDPVNPPATAAPVGQFSSVPDIAKEFFDLDGSDNLSFALSGRSYGPGLPSIQQPYDVCLPEPKFLMLSYDDDKATHYISNTVLSVPSEESSPLNNTYGRTGQNDEIVGWNVYLSPFGVPATVGHEYGLTDEEWLHSFLAPNPDLISEQDDDDVDALDFINPDGGCELWYISVDHEATGIDPNSGTAMVPGIIYEVTPGGPIPVVDPVFHLGIPLGDMVDIDAFEFVWLWDPAQTRNGVALLFSVDEDDPFTVTLDESGGLDPTVIYYSFLDGNFDVFLNNSNEDIDGIAAWHCPLAEDAMIGNGDPRLYVNPLDINSSGSPSTHDVLIGNTAPNTTLNWNAATTYPWITISQLSGTGPAWIQIDLDDNVGGTPRNGTVEITSNSASCPDIIIQVFQSDVPKRGVDDRIVESGPAQLLTPQPHPVAESTVFSFVLENAADVTLGMYDVTGRRVATLADGNFAAGEHQVEWSNGEGNGPTLGAGVYELRLQLDGGFVTQRSFTLIR